MGFWVDHQMSFRWVSEWLWNNIKLRNYIELKKKGGDEENSDARYKKNRWNSDAVSFLVDQTV